MNRERLASLLGVDPDSGAMELLGLAGLPRDPAEVDQRLAARLDAIRSHGAAGTGEAEVARQRLRVAADLIRQRIARSVGRRGSPRFALTEFDRSVLGVLVGSGGWNADSRSRLIALANHYGVGPHGLIRVVTGLNNHARSHGERISIADITGGPDRPAAPGIRTSGSERTDAMIERYTPELRDGSAWATIKLSILFGLLTLLLASAIIVPLWQQQRPDGAARTQTRTAPPPAIAVDQLESDESARERSDPVPRAREAAFEAWPVLPRPIRPAGLEWPAERTGELRDEFDYVARRMLVSAEPGEQAPRRWAHAVEQLGEASLVLPEIERRRLERDLFEVLYASAGRAERVARLLTALGPVSPGEVEAGDIALGSWRIGMLAEIARDQRLPSSLREAAGEKIDRSFGRAGGGGGDRPGPRDREELTAAWLAEVMPALVETISDDRSAQREAERWGSWLEILNRNSFGEERQRQLLNTMERLAARVQSPREDRRVAAIMAHLLGQLDLEGSPTARSRILNWIRSDQLTGKQIWVLSSLLMLDSRADWIDAGAIVMPDAGAALRSRIADDLERRWPEFRRELAGPTRSRRLPVDEREGQRWLGLERNLPDPDRGIGADVDLRRLLQHVRLNEAAAHLGADAVDRAGEVMNAIEASGEGADSSDAGRLTNPHTRGGRAGGRSGRPGQAVGSDGPWAESYEAAGRSAEARARLLRELARRGGSDLGPRDAAVLVREAYRATPLEVREAASRLLQEQFNRGPTVLRELLDQLPDAPHHRHTAALIEAVTNASLPSRHEENWYALARLALVDRLLELFHRGEDPHDLIAEKVRESLESQMMAIRPSESAASTGSPHEAARRLRDRWWSTVSEAAASSDVPAHRLARLDDVQQRHALRAQLARGPLQRTLVEQIGSLDLMAFLVVLEQPSRESAVNELLERALQDRRRATDVIDQLLLTETAISRLWRMRLDVPETEGDS